MSFEHVAAGHNSAAECGELVERIAARFDPTRLKGVDVASAKRCIQKYIAAGLITIARPIGDYAAFQKRKHQLTRSQRMEIDRKQTLQSIRDGERLDRAVSYVKGMGREPHHGELPDIAREWGVDYRRLLNRVKGKTKRSRL